jgi:hypothetical protein
MALTRLAQRAGVRPVGLIVAMDMGILPCEPAGVPFSKAGRHRG